MELLRCPPVGDSNFLTGPWSGKLSPHRFHDQSETIIVLAVRSAGQDDLMPHDLPAKETHVTGAVLLGLVLIAPVTFFCPVPRSIAKDSPDVGFAVF